LISRLELFFAKVLPSPFTLSIGLTLLTLILSMCLGQFDSDASAFVSTLEAWQSGLWNQNLLVFGYQMMLILVLGHVLVLSKPMNSILEFISGSVKSNTSAIFLISISTMLMGFFNWGLGLIFGAILARKIGEKSEREQLNINYPLIGALGYSGMMVWHGGISGSAPLKAAEKGHLNSLMEDFSKSIPSYISTLETIFSTSNLAIFAVILISVPFIFSKLKTNTTIRPTGFNLLNQTNSEETPNHPLENHILVNWIFGGILLFCFILVYSENLVRFNITPNMLNFFMLGLGIALHSSVKHYLASLSEAIKGASGILIQFPLYFGIIGIMKESGLAVSFAEFFISISTETTLPIFTFISSGIVNIFVPSGGGQWAIQGPIALESASRLGVPLPKIIMALSYGDQITNMLQPFWALPLLAITKLKASDIFPFTFILFIIGSIIFITGLLIF
jgi:short-chain fatty acids transporter